MGQEVNRVLCSPVKNINICLSGIKMYDEFYMQLVNLKKYHFSLLELWCLALKINSDIYVL